MADKKISLVTVLPLEEVGPILEGGQTQRELPNGYVIVKSEILPELEKFDDEHMKTLLSESEWSHVRHANLYLRVAAEKPLGGNIDEIRSNGYSDCGEKIDRLLLALNINEKLWSFRPDVRLSWFDSDYPLSSQNIHVRHHSPISTFEGG